MARRGPHLHCCIDIDGPGVVVIAALCGLHLHCCLDTDGPAEVVIMALRGPHLSALLYRKFLPRW